MFFPDLSTRHSPLVSLDHSVRSREKFRRECQSDLFRCLKVNDELKLGCLLHRQISRFGAFQDLIHVDSSTPIEVSVVGPVKHESALVDILLIWVNSRQAVFDGKLDDPPSFAEKAATGGHHNRAHLLLLCGFKE